MSDSTPYTKYEQIVSCWASQSVHKKKTAEEIDVMLGQALDTFSHFKKVTNVLFWIMGAIYAIHYNKFIAQHDDKRHKVKVTTSANLSEEFHKFVDNINYAAFLSISDMIACLLPSIVQYYEGKIPRAITFLRTAMAFHSKISFEDVQAVQASRRTLAAMWDQLSPVSVEGWYKIMRCRRVGWEEICEKEFAGVRKGPQAGDELLDILEGKIKAAKTAAPVIPKRLQDVLKDLEDRHSNAANGQPEEACDSDEEDIDESTDAPSSDKASNKGTKYKWKKFADFTAVGDVRHFTTVECLKYSTEYDTKANKGCPPGWLYYGQGDIQTISEDMFSVLEQVKQHKMLPVVVPNDKGEPVSKEIMLLILDFVSRPELMRQFIEPVYDQDFIMEGVDVIVCNSASMGCEFFSFPSLGAVSENVAEKLALLAKYMEENRNGKFPLQTRPRVADGYLDGATIAEVAKALPAGEVIVTDGKGYNTVKEGDILRPIHNKDKRNFGVRTCRAGMRMGDVVGKGRRISRESFDDEHPDIKAALLELCAASEKYARTIADQLAELDPMLSGLQYLLRNHDSYREAYPRLPLSSEVSTPSIFVGVNTRVAVHQDKNIVNTLNIGNIISLPNAKGEHVKGGNYTLANTSHGGFWVNNKLCFGHNVAHKLTGAHATSSAKYPKGAYRVAVLASVPPTSEEMYQEFQKESEGALRSTTATTVEVLDDENDEVPLQNTTVCSPPTSPGQDIPAVVKEFATFISQAIAMQRNVAGGMSIVKATSNKKLQRLFNKLRPLLRDQTPEHRFVKDYIAHNNATSVRDQIWCCVVVRNVDRPQFFREHAMKLPRDLASVRNLIKTAQTATLTAKILSGKHQRGVSIPKAIMAWEAAFLALPKLEEAAKTKDAYTFFSVLKTLKTYGNFTAWIVTADLILLGVLPDWANLQQGSLKGHKLLLPTVKPSTQSCADIATWLNVLLQDENPYERPIKMLDVEHALCEWSKYSRSNSSTSSTARKKQKTV